MTVKDRFRLELGRLKTLGRDGVSGLVTRLDHVRNRVQTRPRMPKGKGGIKQHSTFIFILEILFVTVVAYFWM